LECKNEKEIKRVTRLLGYGAFDKQFTDYYGLTKEELNEKVSNLTFKNIDEELSKFIKKIRIC
jgi:hypothetical protein